MSYDFLLNLLSIFGLTVFPFLDYLFIQNHYQMVFIALHFIIELIILDLPHFLVSNLLLMSAFEVLSIHFSHNLDPFKKNGSFFILFEIGIAFTNN